MKAAVPRALRLPKEPSEHILADPGVKPGPSRLQKSLQTLEAEGRRRHSGQ